VLAVAGILEDIFGMNMRMEPMSESAHTTEHGPQVRRQRRAPSRAIRARSAVTSGRQLFVDGNPNTAWSRRYHDLVIGHMNDLGGADLLSEAQFSLIRRAAAIECELERLDARLSVGEPVDLDSYGRCAGHLRRLFETIGVERKPRDVTPSIADIAAEIEASKHEESNAA
jgi:hypothetical protein